MPKITFYEQDYTGSGNSITLNQNVLIPGAADADPVESGETPKSKTSEEYILESITDLENDIGKSDYVKADAGYQMAKALLDSGASIIYTVIGTYNASGAFMDDTPDKDKQPGVTAENTQSKQWWNKFADKGIYGLRFITTGGDDSAKANKFAAQAAAERGDAVGLMHIPNDVAKDYDKAWNYVNILPASGEPANLTNLGEVTRGTDEKGREIKEDVSKYATGFVPNFSIVDEDGNEIKFPGYVAYLTCFAKYSGRFAPWFAMAGSVRGALPWRVKLDANFGELAIDKLQARSPVEDPDNPNKTINPVALNPICNIRNYGDLVWGNRTMYPVSIGAGSTVAGLTASSFLNIRMLVSEIKDHLYNIARRYTFDPNSSLLWTRFYNSVVPLLDDMKTNQGIKGYKLTQVKDTKKATIHAVLRIIPIEAVEDFIFNIELADSLEVTEE